MQKKNLTLIGRNVELISGIGGYWIVRVTVVFRTTGKETLTIETFGSSSRSPMEAESCAIEKIGEEFGEL